MKLFARILTDAKVNGYPFICTCTLFPLLIKLLNKLHSNYQATFVCVWSNLKHMMLE